MYCFVGDSCKCSVCCLIENNDNQLPKRLPRVSREAAEKGVWWVADEDLLWIMEESQRRSGLKYDNDFAAAFNKATDLINTWTPNIVGAEVDED